MPKWREKDWNSDKNVKRDRIRKKPSVLKENSELTDAFECPEEDWESRRTPGSFGARVVEVHKGYVFVSREEKLGEIDTRDVWLGTMARKYMIGQRAERNFICVGDRVLCSPSDQLDRSLGSELPQCMLLHMAPRLSKFSRVDPSRTDREHVLAANMQQILIVASFLNPKVRWGLIDRYLVLAEKESVPPVIVLNKTDLLERESEDFRQDCEIRIAEYRRLGYELYTIQANKEHPSKDPAIKAIRDKLKGKITLLSGHSGVGKSSLLNLFKPEILQVVEENPEFYKGRHTTTFASFIKLGTGGFGIDTPGIRSFSIGDQDAIGLGGCFPEIRALLGRCKYRECGHDSEPGCAVKNAVETGEVKPWRLRSYLGMLNNEDFE